VAAADTGGVVPVRGALRSRAELARGDRGRDAARREESDRAIAYLNERAREHEERLLKEGKEAIAREIAERNRPAGWAY
jgi:hypothetical protein